MPRKLGTDAKPVEGRHALGLSTCSDLVALQHQRTRRRGARKTTKKQQEGPEEDWKASGEGASHGREQPGRQQRRLDDAN